MKRVRWLTYLKAGLKRKPVQEALKRNEKVDFDVKASLKILYPYIFRYWKSGVLGIVLVFVAMAITFPMPLVSRYFVDVVMLKHKLNLLVPVLLVMLGLRISTIVLGLLEQFYVSYYEQKIILDIQQDLFKRVLYFPMTFFDQNQSGYLMSRLLSDVQGVRWFFSRTLVQILNNIIRLIGGACFLFYLDWRLALASCTTMPAVIFFARYFANKTRTISHHNMEKQAKVQADLQEALSSVPLIKAFSAEKRTMHKLINNLKSMFLLSLEGSSVSSISGIVMQMAPGISRGMVLIVGAYWVITGKWTVGSLFAFTGYLGYLYGPINFLAGFNGQLQSALLALRRFSDLFSIAPEQGINEGAKIKRLEGRLEFKNVSFAYHQEEPVLENVSFHIAPGERIALVGPSGVGKTTIISLIMRFYRPSEGDIYFDNRPASEYELRSLRRRIGLVSQNTLLLRGTIMENLCYGNLEATDEDVYEAARVAGIHDYIAGLQNGYETKLNEKGVNLSEGQRQRLAIARALISNPDILILDEPSSALDRPTEKSIFEALPDYIKSKTLLMATHRIQTLKYSHRILLLNDKNTISIGTHEELLVSSAYYRSMMED